MALLKAGYWQTTYWPSNYWQEDYWPEYGTVTAPSQPTSLGFARARIRRKRKPDVYFDLDDEAVFMLMLRRNKHNA